MDKSAAVLKLFGKMWTLTDYKVISLVQLPTTNRIYCIFIKKTIMIKNIN